jgi:hypothetical protein
MGEWWWLYTCLSGCKYNDVVLGDHIFTLGNIKAVVEADVIKDFFSL